MSSSLLCFVYFLVIISVGVHHSMLMKVGGQLYEVEPVLSLPGGQAQEGNTFTESPYVV